MMGPREKKKPDDDQYEDLDRLDRHELDDEEPEETPQWAEESGMIETRADRKRAIGA